MGFAPGDRVHLAGLGTGTVVEARGNSRYAINIKGRIVVASLRDLEPADEARSKSRTAAAGSSDVPAAMVASGRHVPSIDLHGRTTAEAVDLVEQYINDALMAGHGELHIIHGRGGGRVRHAVHQYLRRVPVVVSFRLDPHNPGVTIVLFA